MTSLGVYGHFVTSLFPRRTKWLGSRMEMVTSYKVEVGGGLTTLQSGWSAGDGELAMDHRNRSVDGDPRRLTRCNYHASSRGELALESIAVIGMNGTEFAVCVGREACLQGWPLGYWAVGLTVNWPKD